MKTSIKPYMKKNEWSFLRDHLSKDKTMLEYGSGNSTLCLAPLVKKLWSIEHDKLWYEKVKQLVSHLGNVELFYVAQDLPRSIPTKLEQFKTYVDWITDKNISFDVVLLDGRARQWCAEAILEKLNKDHLVFLHDYNLKERPYYAEVTKFYDIIDQCHTMIKMKKR